MRSDPGPEPIDDFSEALGRSLKVLRTERGLERKELADRAGISYSYLAAIENGAKQPSSMVLVALAEALGLRSHELLESVEHRRDRSAAAAPSGDPWWLVGDPPQAMRRATPIPASASPAHTPSSRRSADQQGTPPGPDLASFIGEITDLAERLSPAERDVILNLARKLISQWR